MPRHQRAPAGVDDGVQGNQHVVADRGEVAEHLLAELRVRQFLLEFGDRRLAERACRMDIKPRGEPGGIVERAVIQLRK